jgi:glutaminyl-tRNA synthetase
MVVQDPVRLRILNYEEGKVEMMHIVNNPENEAAGARLIPFSNELYVERDDYMEIPSKGYFRLYPGGMVRLKNGYIIKCEKGVSNPHTGVLEEIHATYIPESRSGSDTSGIQVKGVIHWVSVNESVNVEMRIYDRLFNDEAPDSHENKDFKEFINPDSLKVIPYAKAEPNISQAKSGDKYQFLRLGYFCLDYDSKPGHLVFNRTVTLKDAFAKKK